MTSRADRKRLETKAIILGYAMSRLDRQYLLARGLKSWLEAYSESATAVRCAPAAIKNLRDEFDPYHMNPRKGWHGRAMRPNRQLVLTELSGVSVAALLELVSRILAADNVVVSEAIDSLAGIPRVAANVAERLLTGRLAEEYFLDNCQSLVNVQPEEILDLRDAAAGFDFGIKARPNTAIEIKGMKRERGHILFTDREWGEARKREKDYFLIVVGNLVAKPKARVIIDPAHSLDAKCHYQQSLSVSWTSRVSIL